MKKLILPISFFVIISFGYGQTFHSILLCKTNDPSIGNSVRINYFNMKELSRLTADYLGYKFKDYSITGRNFNAENITRLIDNITLDSLDIVLLYFSTHGAKSRWDSNDFPQVDVPDSLISAYKAHNKLVKKSPKSVLTLVEACSGYQRITPQQSFIYQSLRNEPVKTGTITYKEENFRRLFESECNIIVAAGQPGKNTWATAEGSMFTNCFVRAFQEYMTSENTGYVSWDNLLLQTKQYTYAMTKTTSIKYYPVWEKRQCIDDGVEFFESDTTSFDSTFFSNELKFKVKTKRRRRIFNIGNPYLVSLTISGNNKLMSEVDKVVYFLDNTMEEPIVTLTNKEKNFGYGFSVWGEFPIKAKVYFKSGIIQDLYGQIKL